MAVVTRIAPSPTGDPHVGTAYIGLFNYVFAKQQGGKFILRIEDTDRERYSAESETRIMEMMHWLGLNPDESVSAGGENGPYRQSERLAIYRDHAQQLLETGKLYASFTTAEELEALREEQKRQGKSLGYDGRDRDIPLEEAKTRMAAGEAYVLRLRTPDEGDTVFHDVLRGEIRIPNHEIRDAVMMKSDGYPTYHFANVVDDHLMGVSHVIRAEEWITSTPLHVLLYQAFGWELPQFVHMPLLRNPDKNKSKISKRKLDTSVDSYRQQGILPEALRNFLATMGWSMPNGREFFSLEDMTEAFSLERISLGGPVFDLKKLRHFNAKYIRELLPLEDLAERLKPLLMQEQLPCNDEDYLLDVIDIMAPRAETLQDFIKQGHYFFTDNLSYDDKAKKVLSAGQKYLEELELAFARLDSFDVDSVDDMLHDYVQSQAVPMGKVMQPLRVALTATSNAPSVTDLVSVLGQQRVLQRIAAALIAITNSLPDDKPVKPEDAAHEAV